ncbi:MAG TPA: SpoIIE family protein phosphatase [Polyangia bacterium]|nr:SpoIIE family protein phosphatase [Polyangia bacterium]
MPQISISAGGIDRRIPLGHRTIIGRDEQSHVRLADRSLSRKHAEIHQREGSSYLVDLGSTNGTFVNGVRLDHERALRDGDVIVLGGTTMVFHENLAQPQSPEQFLEEMALGAQEPTRVTTMHEAAAPAARSYPLNDLVRRATRRTSGRDLHPGPNILAILSQASSALLSHHPMPELFERILDLVLSAIPAERAAIVLLDEETGQPVIRARRSRDGAGVLEHVSEAIARPVIDDHLGLLLPDVFEDLRLRRRDSIVAGAIRSAMCVPLWVSATAGQPNRVLGLVYLDSRAREPAFTETDLEILTVLANVAAAKLETARLLEESRERQLLQEDLRLAADIQSRVLPRVAPTVPGFDMAAGTRPCRTVGGDYFDLLLEGDELHLALGDVSGKGLGAAMLMIALRAAVRAHWAIGPLPEATTRINATFHQNVPDDKYATFFIGRLDTGTGRLRYVNAGHNRPLLVRSNGACESLSRGGTALGMFDTAAYDEAVTILEPGDTLLVFSDGVSDTWSDPDSADAAMVEVIRRGRALDAASLQREIFAAADRLGRALDDRTLLLLKRLAA